MLPWIKNKLLCLAHAALSQRTVAAAGTFLLVQGLHVSPETAAKIAAVLGSVLIGSFAHRPPGAPTATGTSPSLRPTLFTPSATAGGTAQAKDPEESK